MNPSSPHANPPPYIGTAGGMVKGAVAVTLFGGLGAAIWLRWLWSRTPPSVRATVPAQHRYAATCVVWGTFASGLVGWGMTVRGIVGAFGNVERAAPAEKARVLAEGISEAMNLTAAGIVLQLVGCLVAIVVGWTLLRRTAILAPRRE